jgi:hypothetical protein
MDVAEPALRYRNLGQGISWQSLHQEVIDVLVHGPPHKPAGDEASNCPDARVSVVMKRVEDASGMAGGYDQPHHSCRNVIQDVTALQGKALNCGTEDFWRAAISGQLSWASAMAAQSSPAPVVAHTTATGEAEGGEAPVPALKAAADNLEGTFKPRLALWKKRNQ